ncbi:hypothetical protein ATCC90586_003699 [Pythium insidiosum]|nr:hypothetical protein ATCC90586_003699 [Pythium insidiosum]
MDGAMAASSCSPLEQLPVVLLAAALEFADHATLHSAEASCRLLRSTVATHELWEALVRRELVVDDSVAHRFSGSKLRADWKYAACLAARRSDPLLQLLRDVVGCSSIDRSVETPTNTLTPSRCWLALRTVYDRLRNASRAGQRLAARASSEIDVEGDHLDEEGEEEDDDDSNVTLRNMANIAQAECGCEMGVACYWSSSPSRDQNTADFIDYRVQERSIVRAIQIVPYRAFWHPDSPTYAPQRVSVSFYARRHGDAPKVLIYESPVYPLVNEMQLQQLDLPRSVWLPRGAIMRLHLLGRQQAETFELPPWIDLHVNEASSNYYSCLSYVNAVGVAMTPSPTALPATRARPRRQRSATID